MRIHRPHWLSKESSESQYEIFWLSAFVVSCINFCGQCLCGNFRHWTLGTGEFRGRSAYRQCLNDKLEHKHVSFPMWYKSFTFVHFELFLFLKSSMILVDPVDCHKFRSDSNIGMKGSISVDLIPISLELR